MVWTKINEHCSTLTQSSFLGIANIVPTIIAFSFWIYIASLVGDEIYGEIIYNMVTKEM